LVVPDERFEPIKHWSGQIGCREQDPFCLSDLAASRPSSRWICSWSCSTIPLSSSVEDCGCCCCAAGTRPTFELVGVCGAFPAMMFDVKSQSNFPKQFVLYGVQFVTPWDPSLLFSASQLLWERGDIVPGLYPILA
jgi:hypothetical protein